MPNRDNQPGDPAHLETVAESFRIAAEFFSSLGDPGQVKRVVEALRADDPRALQDLLEPVPPFPGKCRSLCGAIRVIVEGEELREMKLCRLKPNLSFVQRLLARRIYEKHFGAAPKVVVEAHTDFEEVVTSEVVDVIWPSPYQDELDANGLVDCWTEKVSVPTWSLGPPSWECVDVCA
jgi:hypothetical protein